MSNSVFPKPVSEVLSTLAGIFRYQGKKQICEAIECAHARFDEINYDNWNGGTYTWALRIEVPVHIFVAIEPNLSEIENEISTNLNYVIRSFPNDRIGEVTLSTRPTNKELELWDFSFLL